MSVGILACSRVLMVFVAISCLTVAHAQTAADPEPDLFLSGRVTNTATGQPVPRASVECSGAGRSGRQARTTTKTFSDANGAFRCEHLAPGFYSVGVSRPQFNPGAQSVVLESNASKSDVTVSLTPLSVIAGTVTDESGTPIRGVSILLFQVTIREGRRQTTQVRSVSTDDLGQYRLWNLSTGKYMLKAAGRSKGTTLYYNEQLPAFSTAECFAPVYYGGSSDWLAAPPVELQPGQQITADFRLPLRPARKISGVLTGLTTFRFAQFELTDGQGNAVSARAALSGVGGSFEIMDVPAGAYHLRVTQGENGAKIYGEAQVSVENTDAEEVRIAMQPGVDIRVVQHCGSDLPQSTCVWLSLLPANGALLAPDRAGMFKNVAPGEYELVAQNVFQQPYVTSIMAGGQALRPKQKLMVSAGAPALDVTAAQPSGKLELGIELSDQRAPADVQFLLVPLFDSFEGPQLVPQITVPLAFAPGEYAVYAFHRADLDGLEYRNPDVLRGLGAGTTVKLEPNGSQRVVLRSLSK